MKRSVIIILVSFLIIAMTSCGQKDADGNVPANADSGKTAERAEISRPAGADSVKTLLEKTMEFIRSGCDYSMISDVQDPVAMIAEFIIDDDGFGMDLTLDQAMAKAESFYEPADVFEQKEPELAEMIRDEFRVTEPEEALDELMTAIRDSFRDGSINEDTPGYEKYSQMLTDWDKGTDYMLGHYPDIFSEFPEYVESEAMIGMEGALEQFRQWACFEQYNGDLMRFSDLEPEYRPENSEIGDNGICTYPVGIIDTEYGDWSISMLYYVKDGTYYLISYEIVVY